MFEYLNVWIYVKKALCCCFAAVSYLSCLHRKRAEEENGLKIKVDRMETLKKIILMLRIIGLINKLNGWV